MANNPNPRRGVKRIIAATGYSRQGLMAAYRNEEAFRQEVWLAIVGFPLALWLGDGGLEKAVLLGSLLLVLIVEILNSAVEVVIDRFGGEIHELSGRAKDMGSAAVFLSLLNVVVIWALVLLF